MSKALIADLAASPPPRWSGPSPLRSTSEVAVAMFFFACAAVTVVTTVGIVAVLGVETVHFFRATHLSVFDFLFGTEIDAGAEPPKYGILPLIWGTFMIAIGSSVIALPVGLLSAIYLSEYAHRRVRAILKPTLELLAGVPTIVYGYLAFLLVTPTLKAIFEPIGISVDFYNALSASIVVGVMIIPMVSSLSEDVLSAVPRALREAGYGLGATKFEVSTRIVLPAGLSGVVSSFILAISRAIGETMAVVLAAGLMARITLNPLRSVETMTTYMVGVAGGEDNFTSPEYLSLYAVGAALFAITLSLNIISMLVLRRYREVYQ